MDIDEESRGKCEEDINLAIKYIQKEVIPKIDKMVGPFEAMVAFTVVAESIQNYIEKHEHIASSVLRAHSDDILGKVNLNNFISLN